MDVLGWLRIYKSEDNIMKKLSLVLCFVLMISFSFLGMVGCSNNSDKTSSINKVKESPTDDSSEIYDEYDEPIQLNENVKYVLVAIKSKYIIINSEEDFADLNVAYVGGTDGEVYAKYYEFNETGMYNAVNDLHSGITGKDFDVGLIDEDKLSTYDDWEVVWEMKQ